jgi:hypothetical protein
MFCGILHLRVPCLRERLEGEHTIWNIQSNPINVVVTKHLLNAFADRAHFKCFLFAGVFKHWPGIHDEFQQHVGRLGSWAPIPCAMFCCFDIWTGSYRASAPGFTYPRAHILCPLDIPNWHHSSQLYRWYYGRVLHQGVPSHFTP